MEVLLKRNNWLWYDLFHTWILHPCSSLSVRNRPVKGTDFPGPFSFRLTRVHCITAFSHKSICSVMLMTKTGSFKAVCAFTVFFFCCKNLWRWNSLGSKMKMTPLRVTRNSRLLVLLISLKLCHLIPVFISEASMTTLRLQVRAKPLLLQVQAKPRRWVCIVFLHLCETTCKGQ